MAGLGGFHRRQGASERGEQGPGGLQLGCVLFAAWDWSSMGLLIQSHVTQKHTEGPQFANPVFLDEMVSP